MKKTLLLAGVAGTMFAFNANAFDLNPYVGAKILYSDVDAELTYSDDYGTDKRTYDIGDKGLGGAIAVGAKVNVPYGAFRAEMEYSKKADAKKTYINQDDDKFNTKVEVQTYMINAFYDINTGTKITPYITGGIGYAKLKAKDQYWSEEWGKSLSKTKFAWQIGAGVTYDVNEHIAFDAGYRYIDCGDISVSGTGDAGAGAIYNEKEKLDVTANEVYMGLRYNF